MKLILKRSFKVLDGFEQCQLRDKTTVLAADEYEVERIDNPYPKGESKFIVLKGKKIGACENFWRLFPDEATIEE